MTKKIWLALACCFSLSGFACTNAVPTNDPSFCSSFKSTAVCYCINSGLPERMCQNMNMLYGRMLAVFGTIERACAYQQYTTPQDCIDNWNCYRNGGSDSKGRACSATHAACQ